MQSKQPQSPRPPQPSLDLIVELEASLGEPIDLGITPSGHRRVVPITGGRLFGPRLRGEVLAGGADWQIVHPSGWVSVEARYTLRSESGVPISIVSRGVRHGPDAIMRQLLTGGSPDPAQYRFRTAVQFETDEAGEFAWLNHLTAVAAAIRDPSAVRIDIYEVC